MIHFDQISYSILRFGIIPSSFKCVHCIRKIHKKIYKKLKGIIRNYEKIMRNYKKFIRNYKKIIRNL